MTKAMEDMSLDELLGGAPPSPKRGRPQTNFKMPVPLTPDQKERARMAERVKAEREALKDFADLEDDEDDEDTAPINPNKINGGRREGSGRKDKATQDATQTAHIKYTKARAKLETMKADMAELDFKIKSGDYVPREGVRQASAKAFATTAQTMRSIPDMLERRNGILPELAQDIGVMIDQCLDSLADELEKLYNTNKDKT